MNNLSEERRSACGANMRLGGVNLRGYIIVGVGRIAQRGAGFSNSRQAEGIRHASACVRFFYA